MEIKSREGILKYLRITLLSYSRICYFTSNKDPQKRVKARFLNVSGKSVQMKLTEIPKGVEGNLVFYSYTFIFRFKTRLSAGAEGGLYACAIPDMIETFDRRKYARLKFESRENKIVAIVNKTFDKSFQGILTDLSAGGIGFTIVNVLSAPKVGDVIMTEVALKSQKFQSLAKVVQVRKDQIGCTFLEKSNRFQLDINAIVKQEIDWRSEGVLKNLKKREELMNSLKEAQADHLKSQDDFSKKLGSLDPLTDFISESFNAVGSILLEKEKVEYREKTALDSPQALFLNIHFHKDLLFQCYCLAEQEVLLKIAAPLFHNDLAGRPVNSMIVLEQLGKRLMGHAGFSSNHKGIFGFSRGEVISGNKRLLSDLLRQPSIRAGFNSEIGKFHLILLADNLEDALNRCYQARVREFITMEKMDLIEPISYATLRVFTEFLKLEIREKSVTHRDQLIPRFEITILLDIFFDDLEGKVVLNLSKRLALKIFEILTEETVKEFNSDVKDAVAEVVNMITGNAKGEFENHGIYYKLGTPLVVESREGVVISTMTMKFLSSVYWTSEGFFDLSFSLFKK